MRSLFTIKSFLLSIVILGLAFSTVIGALAENTEAAAPTNTEAGNPNFLARHVQFLTADAITHFRYADKNPGAVTHRDLFYKGTTTVKVSLIGNGSTYVQARGESGRAFNSSYDYTGIGMHERYWSFNVKSFFLGQKLGRHFEVQVGGVEFDRGVGTEATYADNDGWLEGYRLRYTGKGQHGLPERIVATVGYIGDFTQPNVFARLHRMGDENYVQILAAKKLTAKIEASAQFDSIQSVRYTREAVRWQKAPLVIVDELLVEALIRASDNGSFGWSTNLSKGFYKEGRVRIGAFYSDLPKNIFMKGSTTLLMNGDSYVTGKRVGPTMRVIPFKNFEVSLFASGRLDETPGTRYRTQLAVRYQFADLLNRVLRY